MSIYLIKASDEKCSSCSICSSYTIFHYATCQTWIKQICLFSVEDDRYAVLVDVCVEITLETTRSCGEVR